MVSGNRYGKGLQYGMRARDDKDACRRTFKAGVSYSRQEVKGMLQKIYDSIGLTGKTAKAKELAQYLPVTERQRTNEKGKRGYFIEIREI